MSIHYVVILAYCKNVGIYAFEDCKEVLITISTICEMKFFDKDLKLSAVALNIFGIKNEVLLGF